MQVGGRPDDDTQQSSTYERPDLYCLSCYRDDGQTKEAFGLCQNCQEHLCESCYLFHRKPKPLANHVLLDKARMPKVMATGTGSSNYLSPCPKHTDKFIEFYYNSHKKVFCYVCSNIDHNPCQKEYIPDVAASYLKKEEFKAKLQRIPGLRAKCEHIVKNASNKLEVAEKNATTTLEECMTYKAVIIEALERQEDEIRQTKETFQMQAKEKAHEIITSCEDIGSKLTTLESDTAPGKQGGDNSMKIFIHTINSQDQLDQYENNIDQLEKKKVPTDIAFKLNQSVVEMAKTNEFLGKIEMGSNMTMTLSADTEAKKVDSIHVRTSEDNGRCWIAGMTYISDSSIAIADYNNKSIKVVDTGSGKITQRLQLTSGPWDLTPLPDDKIAVTLHFDSSIQILSTKSGLKLNNKFACKTYPRGIQYHQGQLILSYTSENTVEILSLEGKVIRTVISGLNWPRYLDVADDGDILVSDESNHRVLKLDQTGNIRYSYKHADLKEPRGVALCRDGKFIVCSKDINTVHLVSGNGSKIKTLIDKAYGIERPFACLFNERKRLLYISTGDANNYLYVFKLQ